MSFLYNANWSSKEGNGLLSWYPNHSYKQGSSNPKNYIQICDLLNDSNQVPLLLATLNFQSPEQKKLHAVHEDELRTPISRPFHSVITAGKKEFFKKFVFILKIGIRPSRAPREACELLLPGTNSKKQPRNLLRSIL